MYKIGETYKLSVKNEKLNRVLIYTAKILSEDANSIEIETPDKEIRIFSKSYIVDGLLCGVGGNSGKRNDWN